MALAFARSAAGVLSTANDLMSLHAFHAVIWTGFALCCVAFAAHLWVRWVSLRTIIAEDFVLAIVLAIQLGTATICQLRLRNIYMAEAVGNGLAIPPQNFPEIMAAGVAAMTAAQLANLIGLWMVKLSFLLFFRRIFCTARPLYRWVWWGVTAVTLACFGVVLGVFPYHCTTNTIDVIMGECTEPPAIRWEWIGTQVSSAADSLSDVLIMFFPIAIVWKVRISLKKKLYLTTLFLFMLSTIAMAIIRCTINYGRIASDYSQSQNISWSWFWLQMESIVSFLVACLVSFRGLFSQKRNLKPNAAPPVPMARGGEKEAKGWQLYRSILETCHDELEGTATSDWSDVDRHGDSTQSLQRKVTVAAV